jgi:hypothetical protein
LSFQFQKRGDRRIEVRPEYVMVGDDTIIGSTQWTRDDGRRQERYAVIRFRDSKIIDMQECESRREAERFARR